MPSRRPFTSRPGIGLPGFARILDPNRLSYTIVLMPQEPNLLDAAIRWGPYILPTTIRR